MKLPFLDRELEASRLRGLIERSDGALGVLYGRRRCGKSRLLREVVPVERRVLFVGDEREPALQRAAMATEVGRRIEGFDRVVYPDWGALLDRLWRECKPGTVVVVDELPSVVAGSPELPSLLQKLIDHPPAHGVDLIVCGSSQRMMQGLVLDSAAPLYGRATEVLRIDPLAPGWIADALSCPDALATVRAYAVWGGVPRYWELAADFPGPAEAIRALVLDPLGVLHEEPGRLLRDDLRDTVQAASILMLIGQGCHRVSEIAGRLGKPSTALTRPLQRLVEMRLVRRDLPFGESERTTKRTLYRIDDPFLRFWFRFVAPNRTRLESRLIAAVEQDLAPAFGHHAGAVWEELARASVPHLEIEGRRWGPARSWWGAGADRRPLEVDLVAEELGGGRLLVGEVKWSAQPARALAELRKRIERLPLAQGREVVPAVWIAEASGRTDGACVVTAKDVVHVLR